MHPATTVCAPTAPINLLASSELPSIDARKDSELSWVSKVQKNNHSTNNSSRNKHSRTTTTGEATSTRKKSKVKKMVEIGECLETYSDSPPYLIQSFKSIVS